ncbi:MAG: hypothetical protein IJX72_07155 [Clostridia bacterium]|nr:hypothetical protein [Clostridia bacterium]
MKQKRIRLSIAISVLVFLFILCLVVPLILHFTGDNIQWHFFTSIEDFSAIDSYVKKDLSPQDDPNLGNLSVMESYTKIIEYNGKEYILYAYIFHDTAASIEYFHEVTGKKTSNVWNFASSSNTYFHSHYVAYYENCLYYIEGGNRWDFIEAVNFINNSFPITLESLIADHTENE